MTVDENLDLGAFLRKDKDGDRRGPRPGPRAVPAAAPSGISQKAGTMSGGEQQMLAVARAMMGRPKLLLLDEPSMGLAPVLVDLIFDTIETHPRAGRRPCCWSSRTPSRRCGSPTTPTSWSRATSSSRATARKLLRGRRDRPRLPRRLTHSRVLDGRGPPVETFRPRNRWSCPATSAALRSLCARGAARGSPAQTGTGGGPQGPRGSRRLERWVWWVVPP